MFNLALPNFSNDTEKYIYFSKLEKEAKKAKEQARKAISATFNGQDGKIETGFGNVTRSHKTSIKAADSLQQYLHNIGKLDMCKKDEIDVKKVQEFIGLGIIPAEAKIHLLESVSETLTVK
ncbi:hypothetical protein BSG01_031 [Bacillus phage BSG01]|nr:hypothetical protein BSG01_031 [Bacillus phage BSG01]